MTGVTVARMSVYVGVLLAAASCVYACGHAEYKPVRESSSLKIVVRSHYNQTGRWHSQVVLKQDVKLPTEEEKSSQWDIDVRQTSSLCDEAISCLETTIYLTAPLVIPKQQQTVEDFDDITPLPKTPAPHTCPPPTPEQPPTNPSTPQKLQAIPTGYGLYPGVGYYKFNHNVTTWPKAQEICARDGGHLVIINSAAEREVVRTMFAVLNPKSPGSTNSNQIHAGLKYISDGKYATITGVPIGDTGFSVWHAGQPSSGANEPCVSIMVKDITYNDISCFKQILAFICEIEIQ